MQEENSILYQKSQKCRGQNKPKISKAIRATGIKQLKGPSIFFIFFFQGHIWFL